MCLDWILTHKHDYVTQTKALGLDDPSKNRIITLGSACEKVYLDVWSHMICSVISRAFPSSASGMGESNHGWNLFESFFKKEYVDLFFSVDKITRPARDTQANKREVHKETYHDVFASSLDYSEATDFMSHELA